MEEGISLSQAELDKVLNGVRSDNEKNEEHVTGQNAVALSQAELDNLFGNSHSTMRKVEETVPEEDSGNEVVPEEPKSESVSEPSQNAPVSDMSQMTTEEKIAARKARMEAMLKAVNSQSPKRISVVYGSTLSTGAEIDKYEVGSVIELDRAMDSGVDVFCDGKLIARGFIGKHNGKAAVRISQMVD